MATLAPSFWMWDEVGHGHIAPFLKRKEAETMASSSASFWKRHGDDHDHSPPLVRRRRAEVMVTFASGRDHSLLPSFLLEEAWI